MKDAMASRGKPSNTAPNSWTYSIVKLAHRHCHGVARVTVRGFPLLLSHALAVDVHGDGYPGVSKRFHSRNHSTVYDGCGIICV
jgi:hypothetical protein